MWIIISFVAGCLATAYSARLYAASQSGLAKLEAWVAKKKAEK